MEIAERRDTCVCHGGVGDVAPTLTNTPPGDTLGMGIAVFSKPHPLSVGRTRPVSFIMLQALAVFPQFSRIVRFRMSILLIDQLPSRRKFHG
jgi:hypothetical protein